MSNSSILSHPSSHPSSSTAVLLLDYQKLILPRLPPATRSSILAVAASVRSWALSHGIAVHHCTVDILDSRGWGVQATHKVAARAGELRQSVAGKADLAGEADELVAGGLDGKREREWQRPLGVVSALKSEGLLEELRVKGVTSLVVLGVSTGGCVLSTVRGATDEGFVVSVVEDGCADPGERVHDVLVKNVLGMTGHVLGWGKGEVDGLWKEE